MQLWNVWQSDPVSISSNSSFSTSTCYVNALKLTRPGNQSGTINHSTVQMHVYRSAYTFLIHSLLQLISTTWTSKRTELRLCNWLIMYLFSSVWICFKVIAQWWKNTKIKLQLHMKQWHKHSMSLVNLVNLFFFHAAKFKSLHDMSWEQSWDKKEAICYCSKGQTQQKGPLTRPNLTFLPVTRPEDYFPLAE